MKEQEDSIVNINEVEPENGLKVGLYGQYEELFTNENGHPRILDVLYGDAVDFIPGKGSNGQKGWNVIKGKNKPASQMSLNDMNFFIDNSTLREHALVQVYGKEYVEKQWSDKREYEESLNAYYNNFFVRVGTFEEFANGANNLNENQFDDYYKTAARIVTRNAIPDKAVFTREYNDREVLETDWDKKAKDEKWFGRSMKDGTASDELAEDIDFQLYVSELVNNKKILEMNEAQFANGWNLFKEKLRDIYDSAEREPDSSVTTDGSERKDTFISEVNNKVSEIRNVNEPYSTDELVAAADNIIYHTLKTKAAQTSFFSRVTKQDIVPNNDNSGMESVDVLDRAQTNKLITEMRQQLISDPAFKSVIKKGVPQKDFYKEYCSAINREINKDIKKESEIKRELKRDREKSSSVKDFMDNNSIKLDENQVKVITEAYDNLKEYNKGKSPSEHMKNLMNALEDVVDELGNDVDFGSVNMAKIDKLNKMALKYYDKRQGLIFSPFTDDGQSRLAATAKLVRTTNKLAKDIRNQHEDAQMKAEENIRASRMSL